MVINNNLSAEDWNLIISVLNSEASNNTMNEIFPTRKERIEKLLKKIKNK